MADGKVEILSRDADHVVAVAGNVLVQLWLRSVPYEGAQRVDAAGDRMAAAGVPFLTLIVVAADAKPPQAPARQILTTFAQRLAPTLTVGVQVVEATGLKGAIMRSIMTGMSMIVQRVPAVIVKSVPEGVAAASAHGMTLQPDEMAALIKELRGSAAATPQRTSAPSRSPS